MGFLCLDIADSAGSCGAGGAERARGTCRGLFIPVHAVTGFDFHGDCLLSPLQLGLALCWKFCPHTDGLLWISCLFVCLSLFFSELWF